MIGVDTNVLARFLLHDDARHTPLVDAFFSARTTEDPAFVSVAAVVELVWVLVKQQRWPAAEAFRAIRGLLAQSAIVFQHDQEILRALEDAEDSGADFADALIGQLGVSHDCDYSVTFDRKAASLPGMLALG